MLQQLGRQAAADSLVSGFDRFYGVVGTADEFVERLGRLSEAGVQRVMVQWLEVDDIDGLEAMAGSVLPQL